MSVGEESGGAPPRGEGIGGMPLQAHVGEVSGDGGEEERVVFVGGGGEEEGREREVGAVGGGEGEGEGVERQEEDEEREGREIEKEGTERVEKDDKEAEISSKTEVGVVVSSSALTIDVVSSPAAFTGGEYNSGGAEQDSEVKAPRPSTGVSSSGGSRTSSRAKLRGVIFEKVFPRI